MYFDHVKFNDNTSYDYCGACPGIDSQSLEY